MPRDILLDSGELRVERGDLVLGESTAQHIEHILLAQKGEYKQSPLTGIGILNYLNAPINGVMRLKLEREIRLQLEADGAQNVEVKVSKTGRVDITNVEYP